jgi:hypothetical protein
MSEETLRPLDEWLRAAYDSKEAAEEAGCPPPEAFLEAETAGLSPEDRRTLDEHAARCPACAAERDLARLFDEAPGEAGVRPEDLDFVVSRLEETAPVRSAPASSTPNVVAFPGPRRAEAVPAASSQPRRSGSSHALLRFAAAALLVIGAGLGYRAFQSTDPALPSPEIGGVVRGGEVEAVSPAGELAEVPRELRWAHREGAASYRVRIITVDDSVLWEMKTPASPVVIPTEVSTKLHRAVLYTWTVEALDPSGARLATSEPVRFRVKPAPR